MMPRFQQTDTERKVRNLKVVGYKDMRPIDWFTGKRVPLAKGEGNICDRCGAEHAIVFTLADIDTKETFRVGSGCAKRAFGFDPEKDATARKMISEEKRRLEKELAEHREAIVTAEATRIAVIIEKIPLPDVERASAEPRGTDVNGKPRYDIWWKMGDAKARVIHTAHFEKMIEDDFYRLVRGFLEKRALEVIAPEFMKDDGEIWRLRQAIIHRAIWKPFREGADAVRKRWPV
jgi:hypothetical protein